VRPRPRAQVTAKGKAVNTVANAQGNFVVSLPGVSNCGSGTVVAAGDEGSRRLSSFHREAIRSSLLLGWGRTAWSSISLGGSGSHIGTRRKSPNKERPRFRGLSLVGGAWIEHATSCL